MKRFWTENALSITLLLAFLLFWLIQALTGWEVAQAGGGAGLVLLAIASWLVGAAAGIAGSMAVTGRRIRRPVRPTDWAVLR